MTTKGRTDAKRSMWVMVGVADPRAHQWTISMWCSVRVRSASPLVHELNTMSLRCGRQPLRARRRTRGRRNRRR